jgi:hypothetical protein
MLPGSGECFFVYQMSQNDLRSVQKEKSQAEPDDIRASRVVLQLVTGM